MIKMENFQHFSIKSYVVGYGELMIIKVNILVFCENLMSTETFT